MPAVTLTAFRRRYYAFRFLNDFVLVYPVYTILFARAGLSVFEISLLLALWSGSALVLEVPSGALADRWSRRRMLVIAMLAKGACFACWLAADGFGLFALGFALWGLGGSFRSGTQESLLYDTLHAHDATDSYARVAGRANAAQHVAITLAVLIGGLLATYSFQLVLVLSVAAMGVAAAVAFGFQDPPRAADAAAPRPIRATIAAALRQTAGRPVLRGLFAYSAAALAVYGTLDEYDQLYRDWIGMPLVYFGVWSALLMGGQAAGAALAHRVGGPGRTRAKYACAALAGVCLLAATLWPAFALLPVYALAFCVMAVAEVLVETELQHAISSAQRATITSLHSLVLNLSAIVLTVSFGLLSRLDGLRPGLLAFALLLLACGAVGAGEHGKRALRDTTASP